MNLNLLIGHDMRAILAAGVLLTCVASAQANCLGDAGASTDEVAKFKANVSGYVAGMPNSVLQNTIRLMAASDPSTLPMIASFLKNVPLTSQTYVSSGLGEAARECSTTNEAQAREIQLIVVDLPAVLQQAFNRMAGLRSVGLAAAGTGSSSGSSGGQISGFGSLQTSGSTSFPSQYAFANGPTGTPSIVSGALTLSRSSITNTTIVTITNAAAPTLTSP